MTWIYKTVLEECGGLPKMHVEHVSLVFALRCELLAAVLARVDQQLRRGLHGRLTTASSERIRRYLICKSSQQLLKK